MSADVFVFNPFTEGYIARGKAFAPIRHQAMLAEDLANLPQFLCQPGDVVLLARRPSASFLDYLKQAGFPPPEFAELKEGRIDTTDTLWQRELGSLRPWSRGPDSAELLKPLFARMAPEARTPNQHFNDDIAQLYSKAWSASFLNKVLAHCRGRWLCSEQEAGVVVDNLEEALGAIATIRSRGHLRVVVKEAYGVAGHNAIRLWEAELLPAQRQWLTRALSNSRQLVVEPWLEREVDFSVQLEMGPRTLRLCGYTGLVNDRKGQFLANWAEASYTGQLPAKVADLFPVQTDTFGRFHRLYSVIFSLLEAELQRVGFVGPVSIDAFVYRTPPGDCRLKPVVEINPRYTMGRLTVELMKHTCPGSCGLFRLINGTQAQAEGFADLASYARSLSERSPLRLEGEPLHNPGVTRADSSSAILPHSCKIRQGTLCLNDPGQAQACLATFAVSPFPRLSTADLNCA